MRRGGLGGGDEGGEVDGKVGVRGDGDGGGKGAASAAATGVGVEDKLGVAVGPMFAEVKGGNAGDGDDGGPKEERTLEELAVDESFHASLPLDTRRLTSPAGEKRFDRLT